MQDVLVIKCYPIGDFDAREIWSLFKKEIYKSPKLKSVKDKEQTKRKLILAVGELIKTESFGDIKISQIAKLANVDRKLIYRYFGGINGLLEAYVLENDYWMVFSEKMKSVILQGTYETSKQLVADVLQKQFSYFMAEKDMQRLILLELSTKNPLMKSIHNVRETMGQQFLELTDNHFNGKDVNFRAVAALLVGGIYYTILHTMFNGGKFADIDITSEKGQGEILKAIEQIVSWAYSAVE